jgi:hypothetical protein
LNLDDVLFRTSSYCSIGGCVEVGQLADGGVAVRDSKNPGQQPLVFTAAEWTAFVAGVRAGEFGG